jgi:hypothetical protein
MVTPLVGGGGDDDQYVIQSQWFVVSSGDDVVFCVVIHTGSLSLLIESGEMLHYVCCHVKWCLYVLFDDKFRI